MAATDVSGSPSSFFLLIAVTVPSAMMTPDSNEIPKRDCRLTKGVPPDIFEHVPNRRKQPWIILLLFFDHLVDEYQGC